jgi:Flp pilus assembly protein TadD
MRVLFALLFFAIGHPLFAEKDLSALTNELGAAKEQYRRERFDDALATLDRLDKSARPMMESLDLRGCVYLEQGKFDAARKAFEAAHSMKFDAFAPRIHLADTLLRQKKFEEARKEYEDLMEVKAPMWPEYARFGVLLCYLGEHDDRARRAVTTLVFPTETPAYYYAQAAWSFAQGKESEAKKWIGSAKKIFDATKTSWFDRALYQFGWIKKRPAPAIDPFF